jgi:hypothetical protein
MAEAYVRDRGQVVHPAPMTTPGNERVGRHAIEAALADSG